ncbi:MAG: dephospho-CoA kinase [Aquificae bacterium]|nr:dephospho-CoA kinase [Aquificota bacterium]
MKVDWRKYEEKIRELKEIFRKKSEGTDVEVEVITPDDPDFDPSMELPYVRVRYYVDDDHYHERKIELFEHYLQKDTEELVKLIEHFIQEFEAEIDWSEYGGG